MKSVFFHYQPQHAVSETKTASYETQVQSAHENSCLHWQTEQSIPAPSAKLTYYFPFDSFCDNFCVFLGSHTMFIFLERVNACSASIQASQARSRDKRRQAGRFAKYQLAVNANLSSSMKLIHVVEDSRCGAGRLESAPFHSSFRMCERLIALSQMHAKFWFQCRHQRYDYGYTSCELLLSRVHAQWHFNNSVRVYSCKVMSHY